MTQSELLEIELAQNEQIKQGHHPFVVLAELSHSGPSRHKHEFLKAVITDNYMINQARRKLSYQTVEMDLIEKCKPMWDLVQAQCSGDCFISIDITRTIAGRRTYAISAYIHICDDIDIDALVMLAKLSEVNFTELIYD